MNAVGQELLAQAQHLDRRVLEALEGLGCAVDQQPFGCVANAHCWRITQKPLGQRFDGQGQRLGMNHINVDPNHAPGRNTDAGLWPFAPDIDLVVRRVTLAVSAPFGVVVPRAQTVHARLLGARLDRQDRKPVVDQAGAKLRHEICVAHHVL